MQVNIERKEARNLFRIQLNWLASKDIIYRLINKTFNKEAQKDRDLDAYYKNIESFYDLGHSGRGFKDFPPQIQITTPSAAQKIRMNEGFGLQIKMPFSDLLTQLTEHINEYCSTCSTSHKDELEEMVSVLLALSEKVQRRTVRLRLSQWDNGYEVESITVSRVKFNL